MATSLHAHVLSAVIHQERLNRACPWAAAALLALPVLVTGCGTRSSLWPGGQDHHTPPSADASVPDAAIPDATIPDAATPDVAVSDAGSPHKSCGPDKWCWVHPLPQGNDLNAVWRHNNLDAWAIGGHGTLLHYDGSTWNLVPTPSRAWLTDVWGASAGATDDVWAVGSNGTILHYDGNGWSTINSPTTEGLSGVDGTGPNDVWAVGSNGIIVHFDGNTWSLSPSTTTKSLTAVSAINATDVWAVGDQGTVIWYDGLSWHGVQNPATPLAHLNDVRALSATEVWFVGGEKNPDQSFRGLAMRLSDYHWTKFNELDSYPAPFAAVEASGPSAVWVIPEQGSPEGVDKKVMLHYDGIAWSTEKLPARYALWALGGDKPNDMWAVGNAGAVVHRYDDKWHMTYQTPIPGGLPGKWLEAVWGSSAHDMWLGGNFPGLLHANENALSYVPLDFGPLTNRSYIRSIHGSAGNNVWAVGDSGVAFRYDGSAWSRHWLDNKIDLIDVWSGGPDETWTVGCEQGEGPYAGFLFHAENAGWAAYQVNNAPDMCWRTVWGFGPSDVWAAGWKYGGGAGIARFDGTSWTIQDSPVTKHPSDMWGSAPNNVWLVGAEGTLLHYDGATWQDMTGQVGTQDLYAVTGAEGHVWIAGDAGAVWRRDGDAWHKLESGTSNELFDIRALSADDIWTVGENTSVLRYRP